LLALAWSLSGLVAVGCGGGGGSDSSPAPQNRIDVAISGVPAGATAAVTIVDATGNALATLTTSGSAFVTGPGTFTVRADPILAGTTSYVASLMPATLTVPVPPSTSSVSVAYAPARAFGLRLEAVASGLESPTFLASPPGGSDLYVVEQPGRIRRLVNGVPQPPVLDISARVSSGGERGMLSLAFDPQYAANGRVFVYFTDPGGDIAIERFTLPLAGEPAPGTVEATAVRVLTIAHRTFANHNGGQLQFGPDGMLYIGTGDGGGGGDPLGSGQSRDSLLGKLLRIDASTLPYRIPPDNPFVGQPGTRPEIWTLGLRNPWRFAFDVATRSLYIADVGQGEREELNVVADDARGVNFGWNVLEGTICHPPGASCTPAGFTMPVLDYSHADGCSITGGYVYRGAALPEVAGRYFYSDYCGGWLRSVVVAGGVATEQKDWAIASPGNVQSFGVDSAGELYVLTAGGTIYRIARQP
jgi:glucose/arabinose dehydrogenase